MQIITLLSEVNLPCKEMQRKLLAAHLHTIAAFQDLLPYSYTSL